MKIADALEVAYKNGYIKGYKDAMVEAIRVIQDKTTKPQEAIVNHDDPGSTDHN